MNRPDHIVLTTIGVPRVLLDLQRHLAARGQLHRAMVWVIGDHKTPPACAELCRRVTDMGLEVRYLDIAAQDAWGQEHCAGFYRRLPYNNESRRNIGYLLALAGGCRRLICIDDDNFPTDDDFLAGHAPAGLPWNGPLVREAGGFHNVCHLLDLSPPRRVYPRGYPFRLRGLRGGDNQPDEVPAPAGARVGVNAGLWLAEPDVDATTWLNGAIRSTGYRGPDTLVLAQDTWSPINTQNTAVARELIVAFLCVPMGHPLPGGRIERYGDIWAGYFLQSVLAGTLWHVAFGRPLVEHRRNPHDYLADLRHEFWGMMLTDWLVERLRADFRPRSMGITERVFELGEFLCRCAADHWPVGHPVELRQFLVETARTLWLWAQTCEALYACEQPTGESLPAAA